MSLIDISMIGLPFACSILLARRLFTMTIGRKPYWGGSATEGYIDKASQPKTHAFYVVICGFGLVVSLCTTALLAWAAVYQ